MSAWMMRLVTANQRKPITFGSSGGRSYSIGLFDKPNLAGKLPSSSCFVNLKVRTTVVSGFLPRVYRYSPGFSCTNFPSASPTGVSHAIGSFFGLTKEMTKGNILAFAHKLIHQAFCLGRI
jgi:hypothetical protein